jgi:O-antigen/teichoic acid export membrane protein
MLSEVVIDEGVEGAPAPARAPSSPFRIPQIAFRILRSAAGKNGLALVDQAVISGTNFLTTVLIARWCGAGELGAYSLGFSLLVAWSCAQDALLALPYTICRLNPPEGTQQEYAGSVLVHQWMLSALVLVVLVAVAAGLTWGGAAPGVTAVTWMLAAALPFAALRELGRRFAFAHLRVTQALILDGLASAVQITGLFWLMTLGKLSAASAYAVIGVAFALRSAIWLYLARNDFAIRWPRVWPAMQHNWSLGKWLFAWQATLAVQAYFIHWLLALLLGTTATGVYAACMTVVLFSNPFVLGIANALAPRAAHALSEGGIGELRRVIFHTTLLLGTVMTLFCAVVLLSAEELMGWLYDGPQYRGNGHTVALLALAMLASALGMPATNGLMAAKRTRTVFLLAILALGVTVVLVPGLVIWWGLPGAAAGFLVGNVVGSVARWIAFSELVVRTCPRPAPPTPGGPAAVREVLQHAVPSVDEDGWQIKQVGHGAQGTVYFAQAADQEVPHRCLAVKMYWPWAGASVEQVCDQFTSLSHLHAAVNGLTVEGWTVLTPAPVSICPSPLALVMTVVPGKEIEWHLELDSLPPELVEPAARAVVACLREYWRLGHVYGALSFANILCDVEARRLSFIDPGLETSSFLCEGVGKHWYPASRDLAYLIYQTCVRVRSGVANPHSRARQERFTYAVLRAFLESFAPPEEKQSFLQEAQACIQVHLQALGTVWSLRGPWRVLLRWLASRRINRLLGRLRQESDVSNGQA